MKVVALLLALVAVASATPPPKDGMLKVTTTVIDADFTIDGSTIGHPPLSLNVTPGDHLVSIAKPGYRTFTQAIHVVAGKLIEIAVELKAVGRLRVETTPVPASVVIDGVASGDTPVNVELEVGRHRVMATAAGYRDRESIVVIEQGETKLLSITLGELRPH